MNNSNIAGYSIKQALIDASTKLSHNDTARLDAEVLLCHVLTKSRSYLYTYPEKELSQNQVTNYKQLIEQRKQGIPVAYLTGYQEFWSMQFKVNPDTLIPRPETELLIELTLNEFERRLKAAVPNSKLTSATINDNTSAGESNSNDSTFHVLDLGTGSGAIACALAKECPHWQISACDVSEKALQLAQENAKAHRLNNVSFLLSNWFHKLTWLQFDVIISNPPYIALNDPHLNQGDVRFEPQQALTSGQSGLDDIKHIITQAKNYLKPGGLLAIEHGYNQQTAIAELFSQAGYKKIKCHYDLTNQPRITKAYK